MAGVTVSAKLVRGVANKYAPLADYDDEELAEIKAEVIEALNGLGYLVDINVDVL